MKAYKGFNSKLQCRGFQFKVGETYEEPEAILCKHGFHACLNPLDVFAFYFPVDHPRFCEVDLDEVSEERSVNDSKIVGKKIYISKELSINELINAYKDMVPEAETPIFETPDSCSAVLSSKNHRHLDSYDIYKVFPNPLLDQFIRVRVGVFNDHSCVDIKHNQFEESKFCLFAALTGNKNVIESKCCYDSIISIGDNAVIDSSSQSIDIYSSGENAEISISPVCDSHFIRIYCAGKNAKVHLNFKPLGGCHFVNAISVDDSAFLRNYLAKKQILIGGAIGTEIYIDNYYDAHRVLFIDDETLKPDILHSFYYSYYLDT